MTSEVEREDGGEPVAEKASPVIETPTQTETPPQGEGSSAAERTPSDAGAAARGGVPPRPAMAAEAEGERPRRGRGGRRRVCIMCADKMKTVDYKDVSFLRRYLSDRARIETRRKSSCCAKHQRAISRAIKRARHLALLPYTADHMRGASIGYSR